MSSLKMLKIRSLIFWWCALAMVFNSCQPTPFGAGWAVDTAELSQIPFQLESGLIVIQAEINGVNGRFLVDNGFSLSAVNEDFAQRAGLVPQASTTVRDANGQASRRKTVLMDSVSMDQHLFLDTYAYIFNTDLFLPCSNLDGVIGASIIRKAHWKFDFTEELLWISSQAFPLQSPISLHYSGNNSAFIKLRLGEKPISCKIDLGMNSELKIRLDQFPQSLQHTAVEKRIGIHSLSTNGLGKPDSSYTSVEPLKICFEPAQEKHFAHVQILPNLKYSAYLGLGFLQNYTFVLNGPEGNMGLEESKGNTAIPSGNKTYGLSLYPIDGQWSIIQLNPNLWERQLLMQKLRAIDGRYTEDWDWCHFRSFVDSTLNAGHAIEIELIENNRLILLLPKSPPAMALDQVN